MIDFSTLTQAELDALSAEQERRQRLATIPDMVADLAQRFVDDGGDPAVLAAVLPAPVAVPEGD